MKKNWLLIPVALCLLIAPVSLVFAIIKIHETQAAALLIGSCALLYCLFPLIYEKNRTARELRVPWKIVSALTVYAVMPVTAIMMLLMLLDITTNPQHMGNLFGPGPFDTRNVDLIMLLILLALMVLAITVALMTMKKHRARGDAADPPCIALVSYFTAFSAAMLLHLVLVTGYYRLVGGEIRNVYVYALVSFLAYQVFSFAYIIRNRRGLKPFPVLALVANLVSFAAGYIILLETSSYDPLSHAAVIALVPFVFIRDGEGVFAWLRSCAMAGLAGLALLSFSAIQVEHPEHVLSLAGALLAGWGLFVYGDALRLKKAIAVNVLTCSAWMITAALLLANELYYGSFTDRNGAAYSILLHLAFASAAYSAALVVRSWADVRSDVRGFLRKGAVIAPLAATVFLAVGAVATPSDSVKVTADALAGIRLGADSSGLRATGTHPQGGLVVRSRIEGRRGAERNLTPEIAVNISDVCASSLIGTRASYVEAIHITLDRMSPRRVYFRGMRIPAELKTPADLVDLREAMGAELRTETAMSNPIEEGGPLYFVLKKEKGYPSVLQLEYRNYASGPGVERTGRLSAVHLSLGINRQCGTAAEPGTPNKIFTREMVQHLAWLGNDTRYIVVKENSNVQAGPSGTTRIVSTVRQGMIIPARWRYSGADGSWMMMESGWIAADALILEGAAFDRASYGASQVPADDDYGALSEMAKSSCAGNRPFSVPRGSLWSINSNRGIVFTARILAEGDICRLEADGRAFLSRRYPRGEIVEVGDERLNAALREDAKTSGGQVAEGDPGIPVRVYGKIQVITECPQSEGMRMLSGGDPGAGSFVQFYLDRIERI